MKNRTCIALVLLAGAACSVGASAQEAPADTAPGDAAPADPPGLFTEAELALIDEGLAVLNCKRADLEFAKRPIDDPFRLPVVDRALDRPLSLGTECVGWDRTARTGDPAALLQRGWQQSRKRFPNFTWGASRIEQKDVEARLPEAAHEPFRRLLGSIRFSADSLGSVFRKLREDRDAFLRRGLLTQVEKPQLVLDAPDMEQDVFLERLESLNTELSVQIGERTTAAVRDFVAALRTAYADAPPTWEGEVRVSTEAGAVVLSGAGDDVHAVRRDIALIIDVGGNDTWHEGASASLAAGRVCSIAIDLAGDDRYIGGTDLSFGAALGGLAIQWDAAGDDIYQAGHASLGCGILGCGVLVDEGGDDIYRSRDLGQGAGAFGVGLLLDGGGNDLFHVDLFGQGFASTWGCGILVDLAGNDAYDAGGTHLHAPLFKDRYQSLSQGFSIGMRPTASGGVGVLVDVKGNDRYTADIYGQGASYWYALGLLIDDDGNDTYTLGQYGQGAGIHLSAGMLLDRAGQDLYHNMHGVGTGGAHDYAVGLLVDRAGDDYYSGSGGSQGGALTNSVAILLDGGGNDGYSAVKIGKAQGGGGGARDTGSIGLLLDAGGRDLYSELVRDEGVWSKEWIGAGIDVPTAELGPAPSPQAATLTEDEAERLLIEEGTDTDEGGELVWSLEKLWEISCRWEVGDNRVLVPIARKRLIEQGEMSLDLALENLDQGGLVFRAVETVAKAFPRDDVVTRLLAKTWDPEPKVRRGAVRLLGKLGDQDAIERLTGMLDDDDCRVSALGALSALGHAPERAAEFLGSDEDRVGVAAAVCLGKAAKAGDEEAIVALIRALAPDRRFPVRAAAEQQLGKLGAQAVPLLTPLVARTDAMLVQRRGAVRALGRSRSADAAEGVTAGLGSENCWLRLSSFLAAADLLRTLGDAAPTELAEALATAQAAESDPLLMRLRLVTR